MQVYRVNGAFKKFMFAKIWEKDIFSDELKSYSPLSWELLSYRFWVENWSFCSNGIIFVEKQQNIKFLTILLQLSVPRMASINVKYYKNRR